MATDRDADSDAGVDPRFDPVFQRGYDPTLHGGRRPRATARHATVPIPVAPIREPVVTSPIADEASAPTSRPVDPLPIEPPEAEPEPRGRNPFQLALLLVSLISAAGGTFVFWRRFQGDPYGGSGYSQTPNDLFFYQIVDALMAPLLTGAVVGFCLWLVLRAIRPKSTHGE